MLLFDKTNKKPKEKEAAARKALPVRGAHARTTRLEEEEKKVEQAARRKRRARAEAKDVLSAIGYDAMYADGTAQVEEGLFSQTIEFGDISYQSAREENQQSVFAAMSELYDYFGSETSVQLTITNTPIPEREIGRKRFFEKSDPRVDEYVEEYNRILNDKMREGVSNLVRHRYLTFLVGADDLDAAAPRLGPSPRRLHADARPHPLRGAHARRGRAPRARPVTAAAESGVHLLVGQTVPAKRASHQGPHCALGARLQAGRARRLLPGGTAPGAACWSSADLAAISRTTASPTS